MRSHQSKASTLVLPWVTLPWVTLPWVTLPWVTLLIVLPTLFAPACHGTALPGKQDQPLSAVAGQRNHEEKFLLEDEIIGTLEDVSNAAAPSLNLMPIIGILSQEPDPMILKALTKNSRPTASYLASSYVKSIESAGARVVPIRINQPNDYYVKLVSSLNGIMLPGNAADVTRLTGYLRAAKKLYDLVLEANKNGAVMPLWGTGIGFETIALHVAQGGNPLTKCRGRNFANPLNLKPGWETSQMFEGAPAQLMADAQTEKVAANFHQKCVTPQNFESLSVSSEFNVLSTDADRSSLEFVATIEHKLYPIFGTQWSPERNTYEWRKVGVPHSLPAIQLEHYLSMLFVGQARLNSNSFVNKAVETRYLIYNHSPIYISKVYKSNLLQVYSF